MQTFPSPDSQHPLLLPNGQPATMEATFTQYNFQNPTVSTGMGLDLYGRQNNFQTPYVADRQPDGAVSAHAARFDPGGLCRDAGPASRQPRLQQQQHGDSAARRESAKLHSLSELRAQRDLRNHQWDEQLQLAAEHIRAPDERRTVSAGQLHLQQVHERISTPSRTPTSSTARSGCRASASSATTRCATPTPPTWSTWPAVTICPSAPGDSFSPA